DLLLSEVDILEGLGKQVFQGVVLTSRHVALRDDNVTVNQNELRGVRFRRRFGFALAYDAPRRDNRCKDKGKSP
ncbi:MAG TPA: hypothetical protein VIZ19_02420, partial [Roseiarcus sp.]